MTFMDFRIDLNSYIKLFQTMEQEENVLSKKDEYLTYIAYMLGNDHNDEVFNYSTLLYQEYTNNKGHMAESYHEVMNSRLNNYHQNLTTSGNVFEDGTPKNHNESSDSDIGENRSSLYQKQSKKVRSQLKKSDFVRFQQKKAALF